MRTRLRNLWERLRTSLWFVPSCMSFAAAALALAASALDETLAASGAAADPWFLYRGGALGARTLLSTVASSMITVAGVTFSITMVALSLASSQLGPRLLRNFMRDRGNQFALGTFIGTFLFCLIALASVPSSPSDPAPTVSTTLGLALAAASLTVLIYFIHHVSSSIQAERVLESVARELERAIDRVFPERLDDEGVDEGPPPGGDAGPDPIASLPAERSPDRRASLPAKRTGYLQAIDESGLVALAEEADLVLHALCRPGHFVVEGDSLLVAHGAEDLPPELAARARQCFLVGGTRTQEQDPEYGIHQLVEVAVRALSPGVNDPYTALSCVDWLGGVLCRIAERPLRAPRRAGTDGRLRLVVDPVTFRGALAAAFSQIRQCARQTPAVSIRMLESLARIARSARDDDRRAAVREQVDMVFRGAVAATLEGTDRRDLEQRYRDALHAFAR